MQRLVASLVLGMGTLGLLLAPSVLAQAQNSGGGASNAVLPMAGAPATVVVHLPADAKLTIDSQATTSTSGQRRFISPPLENGQEFHYTFRAEFLRDGKTVTAKEVVPVRAGRETVVWLGIPAAANAPASRSVYFAPENQGASPAAAAPRVIYGSTSYPIYGSTSYPVIYGSTAYPGFYPGGEYSAPRVAPMSAQDPLNGAGMPGSDDPMSTRTR